MIRLELKHNEPIEKALKRFKKVCDREGLTRDMRRSSTYEKPSERNKRKQREQEKERAKAIRLEEKKRLKARKARQTAAKGMSRQQAMRKQREAQREAATVTPNTPAE